MRSNKVAPAKGRMKDWKAGAKWAILNHASLTHMNSMSVLFWSAQFSNVGNLPFVT
jgi:hypothetical protein